MRHPLIQSLLAAWLLTCCGASAAELPQKIEAPQTVQELEKAHSANPDYFKQRDQDGMTVFHRACERGDLVVVRRMVELGADVNSNTDRGATPLHATMAGAWSDAMRRSTRPAD